MPTNLNSEWVNGPAVSRVRIETACSTPQGAKIRENSIGALLDQNRGYGPGFDFLRVALAGGVVADHSVAITLGDISHGYAWFLAYSILPMFFALSGFLIAGSAERLSLGNFLINRGLRIVPALAVEVIISALIIGPIFTILPLSAYFSDPKFWHYFTNIFGWIQYYLPGVNFSKPEPGIVNLSLWTVPFELVCYVGISIVIVTGLAKRPLLILLAAVLIRLAPTAANIFGLVDSSGQSSSVILNFLFFTRGAVLLPSFLLGACAYYYRYLIPASWLAGGACVGVGLLLSFFASEQMSSRLSFIILPLVVYLTVLIGCVRFPKLPLYHRGDYSYGIYLYAWPIQQCLITMSNAFSGQPILHFAASMVLATAAAVFSWHLIEKPILLQRRRFSFVGRHIASRE